MSYFELSKLQKEVNESKKVNLFRTINFIWNKLNVDLIQKKKEVSYTVNESILSLEGAEILKKKGCTILFRKQGCFDNGFQPLFIISLTKT